jgi:MFS family permease
VLFFAAAATSRIFRAIVLVMAVFFQFFLIGSVNAASAAWVTSGMGMIFSSGSAFTPVALFLIAGLTGCALARVATVTVLSPPLSNRDLPLRLWITGVWLAWGVVALSYSYVERDVDSFGIWAFQGGIAAAVLLGVGSSLVSGYSRRVLSTVSPRKWVRVVQFPFYSGAENCMVWALAMGFCSVSALTVVSALSVWKSEGDLSSVHLAVFFLYVMAYVCSVRAVWFFLLRKQVTHRLVGVVAGVLIVLGYALPYLLALGGAKTGKEVAWQFGNVFAAFDGKSFDVGKNMIYASVWAVLAGLACLPAFYGAFRSFRPPHSVKADGKND